MDFMKMQNACSIFDTAAKELNHNELLVVLGMTIDYWTSRNNENPESLIKELAIVSAQVNETEGKAIV